MSQLTKEQAAAELTKLVTAVYDAVGEATAFADEHKLTFSIDIAYGMGGTYNGDAENRYVPNYVDPEDHDGWYPSSQSC
jgi:hypothetical protein